jgi:hypothetical protein
MEETFYVAARVVTSSALARGSLIPHMAVHVSFYFDEICPVCATPNRQVLIVFDGSSPLLSASLKFQRAEPRAAGSSGKC